MENRAKSELAKRALARKSLKAFLVQKWERFNEESFLDNWHINLLCKYLQATMSEEPLTRLMINMPPSYGKTEIIARTFIAWALGNNPKRKFIYISYSDELCKKISNQVRALLKSNFWRLTFNRQAIFLQDNSSEFVLLEGGGLFVTTLKSALTGFHAHQIIIDDPIKVVDMSSKSERERVNQNFKESVLSRLQNNKSNITIMMQRLGDNDLCGFLLDEKVFSKEVIEKWHILKLEALNTEEKEYKIDDFYYKREALEPLFPARHNKIELEELKLAMGEDEFSTQYQQEPQVSEAGFFETQFFKSIQSYEVGECNDYIFVDSAMSLNSSADNRAAVCIGVEMLENEPRYIVKDCLFGIWDEEAMCKHCVDMLLNYPKASMLIEAEGGGIILERLLQKEIVRVNEARKKSGGALISNYISTYPASRKIPKIEKIKALKPYFNTGRLVFLAQARGLEQIKKELFSFNPSKPFRRDDCIDCIASALNSPSTRPPSAKIVSLNSTRAPIRTTWRI